jgi:hypothetical protein
MSATIFAFADADRTVIIDSVSFQTEEAIEAPFPIQDDSATRLEEKLDKALRMMATMQQRIDSLDATLMRVLMR